MSVVAGDQGYGEARNAMRERRDPVHPMTWRSPDLAAAAVALGCQDRWGAVAALLC